MKKIAFIGGGSAKFVFTLIKDLFSYEELQQVHISLMDIDAERLERSRAIIQKVISDRKLPAKVEATLDQKRALAGADYVIITVMVGGFKHFKSDGEIPAKYGVLPAIGDTIGPGGVFRLVRTAPVLQQIAGNLKEVAPHALILNYANPMAMNVWALLEYGHARTVGLCHSIQGVILITFEKQWWGLPAGTLHYTAGGINHVNFYLTLEHEGRDFYPELLKRKAAAIKQTPALRAHYEILEHLGYWPAEGTHHQSEYYPWFRKNQQTVDYYQLASFEGYKNDLKNSQQKIIEVEDMIAGRKPIIYERSHEYGAYIIHALESGAPLLFYGNVRNQGLIANLPAEAVVEVPCHADANGIFPGRVGEIPPPLAAVMTPHIHVHKMAVQAVMNKDRRMIRQAIQADPLTGAILTLPKIKQMVDELMEENREYMKDWP